MFLPFHFTAWLLASPYTLRYIPLPAQLRSFSSQRMPQLEGTIKGSVAKFNFWVKIQKSGIRNSRSYRLPNFRKSNFATEPRIEHGDDAGELSAGTVTVMMREQWDCLRLQEPHTTT